MKPEDFNKVTELPIGLGMDKIEYEECACIALNKHIEGNIPFNEPTQFEYYHPDMVKNGWFNDHQNKNYTLTKKALGILWGKYGKNN